MNPSHRTALLEGERAGSRFALAQPSRLPLGLIGAQLGQHAGSSLEFKEHREYQPGDDLRRIDWSAFARSDRLHLKLFREEVSPHMDVLIDGSASMDLEDTAKSAAALGIAAALAAAADNAGYTHNAWLATDRCTPIPRGSDAPHQWGDVAFDGKVTLDKTLAAMPPMWRPQSIRVLVSDLLWLADPMDILQVLSQRAAVVCVVQVLAEADTQPPHHGSIRLVDRETQEVREVFIDAEAQRRYREALARHQDQWQRACTQTGAMMTTIVAEPLVKNWDLSPLVESGILRVQ